MYLILKNRKYNTSQVKKERISFSQLTPCAIAKIYNNKNVFLLQVFIARSLQFQEPPDT